MHKIFKIGESIFIPKKGGGNLKKSAQYLIIGSLAGVANGLFGSGGGLFLVPLLTKWSGLEQKRAFATSVAVVVPLSAVSLLVFLWRGSLDFVAALPYLIGGAVGGILSGCLFPKFSATLLRRLFGILLIYGGIRAVFLW